MLCLSFRRIRLVCSLLMLPFVLPLHPTAVFFFSFSNLIIPLILRGWGRALFCSNQNKPRSREHGWAHAGGAGKSRPIFTTLKSGDVMYHVQTTRRNMHPLEIHVHSKCNTFATSTNFQDCKISNPPARQELKRPKIIPDHPYRPQQLYHISLTWRCHHPH